MQAGRPEKEKKKGMKGETRVDWHNLGIEMLAVPLWRYLHRFLLWPTTRGGGDFFWGWD